MNIVVSSVSPEPSPGLICVPCPWSLFDNGLFPSQGFLLLSAGLFSTGLLGSDGVTGLVSAGLLGCVGFVCSTGFAGSVGIVSFTICSVTSSGTPALSNNS